MSSNEGKYRYPGTRYFTSEDKDIFHGRKKDSRRLHAQIMSCETVVLHGDSGLGKSSLIQAGIIPLLKEKNTNYVPVTIRFNSNTASLASSIGDVAEQDDYLIRKTIRKIDKHVGIPDVDLPFISKKEADLWCVAKQFEKKGQSLLLIFDQFENIGVYGQEQIDHFKNKLAELFKRAIPAAIDEEIDLKSEEVDLEQLSEEEKKQFNADLNFLEDPLSVKIVFVVREDKLGIMSLLSDAFPNILKNDYKLSAFDRESAIEAITIPAGLPKKEIYEVQSFQFSDDALLKLLNELKDEESGKYDPLQIQILCSSIERGVENNIDQEANVCYQIIADDIPRAKDVIKGFYNRIWQVVQEKLELEDGEFTRLRKKIIKHFEIREKRNLVHQGTLFKIDRGEEIIAILEEKGLILKNPIGSNIYYWLCHDRLVNPLLQDLEVLRAAKQAQEEAKQALHEREERLLKIAIETKRLRDEQERIEKEQKRKFTWYSIVISILSLSLATILYFNYIASETERSGEEEKILSLSKSLRTTNPTLSYKIAKYWTVENHGDVSDEFKNYVTQYDSSAYSYLIDVFPTFGEVVSVDWSFESEKLIIDEYYTSTHWSSKDNSIKKSFPNDGKRIKMLNYDGGTHQLIAFDDSLKLYDSLGHYVQSYPNKESDPRLIKISKNGQFMYMDEFIYDFQTAELIGIVPQGKGNNGILAVEFFNNENLLAIGHWSGHIDIYKFDENETKHIKYLNPPERITNSVITSIAIDPNDEFLVAGNRQNTIEVWPLNDLKGIVNNYEIDKNAERSYPSLVLEGHQSNITALSISQDSELLLSGEENGLSILWDLKTGKQLSILRGSNAQGSVEYVDFSSPSSMITSYSDNIVCLWERDKASSVYERLPNYSPFDYSVLGLSAKYYLEEDASTNINQCAYNTLLHLMSIPETNQYPDDQHYKIILNNSLYDISRKYNALLDSSAYYQKIHPDMQQLIFQEILDLKLRIPKLLMFTEDKLNQKKRMVDRYVQSLDSLSKEIVYPTIAIKHANKLIDVAREINHLDSLNNEHIIKLCINKAEDAAIQFKDAHPNPIEVMVLWSEIINFHSSFQEYGRAFEAARTAVNYYPEKEYFWEELTDAGLLAGKFEEVTAIIGELEEFDPFMITVYQDINLSLTYLLTDDWAKFKTIYDQILNDGFPKDPVNEYYVGKIIDLEDAGQFDREKPVSKKALELIEYEEYTQAD